MDETPFDQVAKSYDRWYLENPKVLLLEREAIAALHLEGMTLDVGAGTGMLSPPGTVCLDISLPMLIQAISRGLTVVRARAEKLPFLDSCFDNVLMTAAISFFQDRESALREACRVIRPGGSLAICFINARSPWGELYRRKALEGHPIYSHATLLGMDEVRGLMESNGMELDLVVSCLQKGPGEILDEDDVIRGDNGGFVCVRGRKHQARG